ncbi:MULTISPECIES: methionine/alanine import family NSS transporter small subunit [Alteribacillus]|uniref:Putative methionine and alanine importer, small subunit n=1 Tax=Alteribacillus bidgolensis TaxID=930129 RepID=A0A1G8EHR8_9BACI|nr:MULTISPECIES: methionine/alanine import family NSS transporter small subunit [Alteribacillus]SDH69463.1 Putative methionine and alanine importer, small subunit [Alteribacillus bidgolensis]
MTGSAIFMMLLGMIIIWGGMAASIMHARKVSKNNNN